MHLPALVREQTKKRCTLCKSNLKQRGETTHINADDNAVNSPYTWKMPTDTLLIADLSFLLNHPAIIYLAKTDVGYKHGGRLHQADGKANIVFMDAHVEGRSLKQTNGIVMEFKK